MDQRTLSALTKLHHLSIMKSDAELAKLASVAATRNRLRGAIDTLRNTEAPLGRDPSPNTALDPALVGARLAHLRWVEAQQKRLNQQLALVTADYLRQKPAAARAFGRAQVLEQLGDKARLSLQRDKSRKTNDAP